MNVARSETAGEALVSRFERLRSRGGVVLDVDDTLLARGGANRTGESYAESGAARVLPDLLIAGVRIVLMSGHGYRQLARRLVEPLCADVQARGGAGPLARLVVYANRGATKAAWTGAEMSVDSAYARQHEIPGHDLRVLLDLAHAAAQDMAADALLEAPTVEDREGCAVALRPVPSGLQHHAGRDPDLRGEVIRELDATLCAARLGRAYQVQAEGRSTITVSRRSVDKGVALRDLIATLTSELGVSAAEVERSLVYVGDEFEPGGNDAVIAAEFPDCVCYDVGVAPQHVTASVHSSVARYGLAGTAATQRILLDLVRGVGAH